MDVPHNAISQHGLLYLSIWFSRLVSYIRKLTCGLFMIVDKMDWSFLQSLPAGSLPSPPSSLPPPLPSPPSPPPSENPSLPRSPRPSAREPGSGRGSGLKWHSCDSAGRGFGQAGDRRGARGQGQGGRGQGRHQQLDGIRLGLQVGKAKSSFHGKEGREEWCCLQTEKEVFGQIKAAVEMLFFTVKSNLSKKVVDEARYKLFALMQERDCC